MQYLQDRDAEETAGAVNADENDVDSLQLNKNAFKLWSYVTKNLPKVPFLGSVAPSTIAEKDEDSETTPPAAPDSWILSGIIYIYPLIKIIVLVLINL
jgi:hypothetical protein